MRFRDVVSAEFERRHRQNPRYSRRAFARLLGVHHATVSRLLRSTRPVQASTIAVLGPRLGLSPAKIAAAVALEDTAAVIDGIGRRTFRPNSRWLASVAGISVDRVNVALEALLRSGRLRMASANRWLLN